MSSSKDDFSDTDSDDGFNEDMEALKRACQITGKDPIDDDPPRQPSTTAAAAADEIGVPSVSTSSEAESEDEEDSDLQMVLSVQKRFAVRMDMEDEPLSMEPLFTLPPDWSDNDDCEDDYETLRAIQRRFAAYSEGSSKDNMEEILHRPVQVGDTIIDSEKETSNSFVDRTNAREGFVNCVDTRETTSKKSEAHDDARGTQPSDFVERNGPAADDVAGLPRKSSHFPKSALAFVDAIKKNRSCQKLMRSKMIQMEARIEELNKLMERVKILKDFQVACKKRTGRSLSQKKDARVQLISLPKLRANMKFNDKKIPAIYKGPPENLHVANYKEALKTFAISVSKEKWSKEESGNLLKGVKQQFQEMLLQRSVDLLSEADGSYDSSNVDSIIVSIKDLDITPEKIRLFLPKVNWEQLAAMYVPGRSGAECQTRFLNFEDPLINHNPWTAMEDKNILHIVQENGLNNWIDIAASLGTNRTPFQCLARYQRSLNASILKREWSKEEDNELRIAVETYGESNWQTVASMMEGRTGTQCSNRWLKTLNPARKRVGKWTAEEDKRLKVAVTLFGPKTWKKVASCVPGRTQVQCRERWVNCLDPSLKMAEWTEQEDSKLEAAISEHGYCWSKVAACIPRRTDNQCLRRWKVLFPNEVPLLQAARKIQKAALISNFVDRESERPALGPKDFRLAETYGITESEDPDHSGRKKRRSRRTDAQESIEKDALSGETCSEEVPRLKNGKEVDNLHGRPPRKGRSKNSRSVKKNPSSSSCSHLSPGEDQMLLDTSNGEEIRKSRVNDGKSKRKPQVQKKRASAKSKSVEVAPTPSAICEENMVIEANQNEYRYSDPTEECSLPTLAYPDDAAMRSEKASKLQPRRRRSKTVVELPETPLEVDTEAGDTSIFNTETEGKNGRVYSRKRKRKTQETCSSSDYASLAFVDDQITDLTPAHIQTNMSIHGDGCLQVARDKSSSCRVDIASNQHLGNFEDSVRSSDRNHENAIALSEIEEENITLTSFPQSQALEDEAEDDETLAHFYNKLKKRRTEGL